MKKWISGLIILVVAITLGGWMYVDHANKETTYQTNLNNGKAALKEQDYHQAKKDFQKALSVRPDSHEANGSVSQVEKFMDGERKLKSNDFQPAKDSFQMAANSANGSSGLSEQAKQKVDLVNSVTKNINQFNEIYKTAVEQHNAKNYALSNSTLNQILQADQINQTYYGDVLAKSEDLKKSNDKSLNAATDAVSKKNQATSDNANNSLNTTTNLSNGDSDLSQFNVYTNPQEYANRFVNSEVDSTTTDADNSNIANGSLSPTNDPYNVYTNPTVYANRFN